MGNTSFHIERLNLSHIGDLAEMYQIVFRQKVSPKYFELKYGLFDRSISNFSHALLVDNKVVGFFGVRIVKYQRGKESIYIPQTGDYFILDKYRGTGLFQELYETVLEELRKENFVLACAFQSEQTYKISQRWGWKDAKHLQRFHLVSSPRILGKLLKIVGLDTWRFNRFKSEIQAFHSDFDMTELNKSETQFSAVFDTNFYRTKEFTNHFQVTISGCTVWLKWQGNLSVGFVYFHKEANIPDFIETIKQLTKKAFIHETVIHLQEESKEAIQLRAYISPQPSFKVSSFLLDESPTFEMENVKLNLMEMDIF